METLGHFDFVKTNHNRHLAQIKERERLAKLIDEITNDKGEKNEKDTDTIQKKL